jgi:hypothetical protein
MPKTLKFFIRPKTIVLNRWFDVVVQYKQIIAFNQAMSNFDEPKMSFFNLLETEKQHVEKQLKNPNRYYKPLTPICCQVHEV